MENACLPRAVLDSACSLGSKSEDLNRYLFAFSSNPPEGRLSPVAATEFRRTDGGPAFALRNAALQEAANLTRLVVCSLEQQLGEVWTARDSVGVGGRGEAAPPTKALVENAVRGRAIPLAISLLKQTKARLSAAAAAVAAALRAASVSFGE